MSQSNPFKTDSEGNIILKPVLGWTVAPLEETVVALRIDYADAKEDIETGGKAFQFALKPERCLELARVLTKQAQRLIDYKLPPGKSPN